MQQVGSHSPPDVAVVNSSRNGTGRTGPVQSKDNSIVPGSTQSIEDKVRGSKNTISARESRAKMRLMNELLQKEDDQARRLNVQLKAGLACMISYSMVLLEKLNPPVDFLDMWQMANEMSGASSVDQKKAEDLDNKIEE